MMDQIILWSSLITPPEPFFFRVIFEIDESKATHRDNFQRRQ